MRRMAPKAVASGLLTTYTTTGPTDCPVTSRSCSTRSSLCLSAGCKLRGFPLDDHIATLLDFISPSSDAQVWQKLLREPLTVSIAELSAILELEPSVEATPDPVPGDQIYYVRTFPLKVESLLCIIAKWEKQGRHIDECVA